MGLIKLIFKLLVLPLIVAVTLIQWVGIFFTQFSTAIFNLLAGLMFLITIAGWMFGISAGAETLRLLAVMNGRDWIRFRPSTWEPPFALWNARALKPTSAILTGILRRLTA